MLFVQFGINSTRDVWKFCQIGLAPRLVQFWQNFQTSLALLMPNCTHNRMITYTYREAIPFIFCFHVDMFLFNFPIKPGAAEDR